MRYAYELKQTVRQLRGVYEEIKGMEELDTEVAYIRKRTLVDSWREIEITHIRLFGWKTLCGHDINVENIRGTGHIKARVFIEEALKTEKTGRYRDSGVCVSCAKRLINMLKAKKRKQLNDKGIQKLEKVIKKGLTS